MFRKLNTRGLLIVFVVLLGIVVLVNVIDSKKGDRSFKEELFTADTSKITGIVITSPQQPGKKVELIKKDQQWKVRKGDKTYTADENGINSILAALQEMKVKGIAAAGKDNWEKFEVTDSTAVHVVIKSNKKILEELWISYQQPQTQSPYAYNQQGTMTTYARVEGDKNIYAVDGFLRMTFSPDINNYRNKELVEVNKHDITRVKFDYPSDSSFVLQKENNQWQVSGEAADSASVEKYLNNISKLSSFTIVDEEQLQLDVPSHQVVIEGNNLQSPVMLSAYPESGNQYIVHSSENPETYFRSEDNGLFEKIFIPGNQLR
jgi:hypothetical protein